MAFKKANELTAAAAVRLTLRFPFWTEVFYSMQVFEAAPEMGIPTQATDGRNLWVNRKFFSGIPLEQQVAELVHELGHKIFLHPSRRGNREPKLWNIACDYVINAMMKVNGFNIPSDWLLDMRYEGWLAEKVYADLVKRQRESGGKGVGGGGVPQMPAGRDDLIEPKFNSQEERERYEAEIQQVVEKAIAMAKAFGKLPIGMEQGTIEAYRAAEEPWYNHLHRYMQSLSLSEYNWKRINRRALLTHKCFAPSVISEALGDVALFIDTSGSCYSKAQQAGFAQHLNAILAEAKPRRVLLFYFDTKVYDGEEIQAGELDVSLRPRGGGGTSFVPIFQRLEEDGIEPEVCIILTDLCGYFPDRAPDYPVLWASTDDDETAPFGEVIYVR